MRAAGNVSENAFNYSVTSCFHVQPTLLHFVLTHPLSQVLSPFPGVPKGGKGMQRTESLGSRLARASG